jgi:hemerythrin
VEAPEYSGAFFCVEAFVRYADIASMTQWTEAYSVGIAQFDGQHKQLFQLIGDLHDAMKSGQAKDKMAQILKSLVGYTEMHFRQEEEALIRAHYSAFTLHKMEHDKFRAKVADFQKDFQAGVAAISIDAMDFLSGWLVNHIMKTDQQYAAVLKQ